MIKYGLISETDGRTLEKTMDLICNNFNSEIIKVAEIGVYAGETGNGIFKYLWDYKNRNVEITGIDNNRDGEEFRYFGNYENIITGNSNEVYNQLKDESQHLIFVDGCHTYSSVVADFMCYKNKVIKGAYMAFHDVGMHLKKTDGWQGICDKNDPDFCLGGVRKALKEIGLLDNKFDGWEFIMEDADINDEGGGVAIFRRKK
ncbi:MAG: class I SAM-dependent methyltransferase [Bacteroides sp.]|nr:class I SAM-dependent methyltransferase [Bacteroides sp.]